MPCCSGSAACLHAGVKPKTHAHASPSPTRAQTVPSCQPLFRNTFNYHTVSVAPPDMDECFEFLGEPRQPPGSRLL